MEKIMINKHNQETINKIIDLSKLTEVELKLLKRHIYIELAKRKSNVV